MSGAMALVDGANHRLFGWIQMVTKRQGGIQVAAADQRAEDGHMLIDGNDVALFEVALIPLIVEVENHGDDFKWLIEKYIIGSRE